MTEKIGNITLDYEFYPGEDLYSDGDIEEEMLEIAMNYPEEEFPRIIEERGSWPIFYHMSPLRENIIEWVPVSKEMKVLEVGSGCGAITGALARKAGSVTCIELSKRRSMINAYRHKDCDNVTIQVGNFQDIEKTLDNDYDFIFLIGVFEYAKGYIGTERPYERFMEILRKHLKGNGQGGRLIIAIENKFGLKYWAGCREDHQGFFFSGLEDYPQDTGVRTFTREGLEKICEANGCTEYSFYYPYPDYKFMTSIYSDEYLPHVGELCTNMRNFDRSRLLLFDEKNVFDTIIREGLFPLYSNSYFLVVGKELPVKFSKYSNDRATEYAICTDIRQSESDAERAEFSADTAKMVVEKRNTTKQAASHVLAMKQAYEKLAERYKGGNLQINRCSLSSKGTPIFEFTAGRNLEELFDELLDRQDFEGFEALFKEYIERISYNSGVAITDYDLIFANILVDGDNWTAIDYEWTFEEEIPAEKIAYRALYCYQLGAAKRQQVADRMLQNVLHLTEEESKWVVDKEKEIQKKIAGERMSVGQIRNLIGNPIYNPLGLDLGEAESSESNLVQIYTDNGSGFSEDNSFMLAEKRGAMHREEGAGKENISFSLHFPADTKAVRIDPDHEPCMVAIEKALWNGKNLSMREVKKIGSFATNGKSIKNGVIVFEKEDPNFTFNLKNIPKQKDNILEISMNVVKLPKSVMDRLVR